MKIFKTEQEFIDYVAPLAQKVSKRYGMLVSVIIAQSALELGYAIKDYWDNPSIVDLLKYNNMVGQKSDLLSSSWYDYSVWDGRSFEKKTPEVYNGKRVTITDSFRIFDDVEQSFADYVLFLLYASNEGYHGTPKYGKDVVSIKEPKKLIETISAKGYATDPKYAISVMKIVNKHNLTKYDDVSGVEPTKYIPPALKTSSAKTDEIKIIDRTAYNTPPRWGDTREALVFHFLGVPHADNPDLYDGGYGGQWYISRKGEIYHSVKEGGVTWSVGSGGWGLKTEEWNNDNTESVEMGCENDNDSDDIYDKKWWFHMVTQESAVKLARYWLEMRGYGVSKESVEKRILVHNSITMKPCPAPFLHCANYQSPNESGHRNWSFAEFKEKIWKDYNVEPKTQTELAREVFIDTASRVCETARELGWVYGDSQSKIPCKDGKISCDRLVARTLWQCGFHDQRKGGETCGTLDEYLTSHGWTKVTIKYKIKPGAVVAVKNKGESFINHVFIVESYNLKKETCTKYDTGSQERINAKQPFMNVPLVEWKEREFVCAWNCTSYLAPGISDGRYLYNGVDYSPVFNKDYYSKLNPDLARIFGTDRKKLFEHFINSGMREGRQACAEFCVHTYRDRYSDLKKAFGNDLTKYYAHYCTHGKDEGRIGN